jgi:hypothetical protein
MPTVYKLKLRRKQKSHQTSTQHCYINKKGSNLKEFSMHLQLQNNVSEFDDRGEIRKHHSQRGGLLSQLQQPSKSNVQPLNQ